MIYVSHVPEWRPAMLPKSTNHGAVMRPGFVCVHQLENGNGQCGGNVFDLSDAVGDHGCMVEEAPMTRMTDDELRDVFKEAGKVQLGICCMTREELNDAVRAVADAAERRVLEHLGLWMASEQLDGAQASYWALGRKLDEMREELDRA